MICGGKSGGSPISRVGNQVSSREPRPPDHFWFDLGPTADHKMVWGRAQFWIRFSKDIATTFFECGSQLFRIWPTTFGDLVRNFFNIRDQLLEKICSTFLMFLKNFFPVKHYNREFHLGNLTSTNWLSV